MRAVVIYEVKFDASQLTSGIYIYKIQAVDFLQTRKMILINLRNPPPQAVVV